MESADMGALRESSMLPSFPPFRRSHLRSNSYDTLVRIYTHLSGFNAATQPLNDPDSNSGSVDRGNQEKEAKSSENVGSDFMHHKDNLLHKEIQEVHETTEVVGDKGRDHSANKMVLDNIESLLGTEETSTQANGNEEKKLMDELELVVKGTEDLFRDNDLIPMNSGLGDKQNGGIEVELMDYQVDDIELLRSVLNTPGDANHGDKSDKLCCESNAMNSNSILVEEGDLEEGEISGDSGMNDNSSDESSANASIFREMEVDKVQNSDNVTGNIIHPCKVGYEGKEKGSESYSIMVNALQGASNNAQVEAGTTDRNGISHGVEVAITKETIECDKAGKYGSEPNPWIGKDRHIASNGINGLPTYPTQNQVLHQGFSKENTAIDLGNSSAIELVDSSRKRKRRPESKEKKLKKRIKNRKKRAEKNRELGVTRLKLPPPIQKPKTVRTCRHYLNGRCHEGDKCKFSHDAIPLTKSTPCVHFVHQSCMKGDDCPFDHQLSKYPCNNFVSKGSCIRGASCLFQHQIPTNKNIPTPPNVCSPELKSRQLSGNTNISKPVDNHGKSSVQQRNFTNSTGIHSHIDAERKVTGTVQKQPALPPKGISFIDVSKLSRSPSTPKECMVTPNPGSLVQTEARADQSASGTNQNMKGVPKKLVAAPPKGINFLVFGKGPVCSFKSKISSHVNKKNGGKLPQLINIGLPEPGISSLNKDDSSNVSNGTKQNLTPTNEVIQEGKKESDNSQTLNVTPAMLPVRPLVLSSERLVSGYHKHASKSGQRALSSTLTFAAELESDIKMKSTAGAIPVGSEENK